MGGVSKRSQKGNHRAARHERQRRRYADQICKDLSDAKVTDALRNHQPLDLDKPGLGQNYCVECDRYFITRPTLETHMVSKKHRRKVKELQDTPYTQHEADLAAGMGNPTTSTV
mmetsp:Transcript_12128/g.21927  ORF Transcript_12128/g.21927 Transcript_12128/m.21927 type:complete len:114 (-) Transcript_12128:1356-1697(-)